MRWHGWRKGLLVAAGAVLLPEAMAWAATLSAGQAIQASGLDDALATAWHYLNGPAGKLAGVGVALHGATKIGDETARINPWMKVAGGGAIAFVPGIISTFFDSAPASTGLAAMPGLLAHVVDGFLGWRLVQDPIFYVALGITVWLLALSRSTARGRVAVG